MSTERGGYRISLGGGASIDSYMELAKATYRCAAPPFDACAPPSILVRPYSIFVPPPSNAP